MTRQFYLFFYSKLCTHLQPIVQTIIFIYWSAFTVIFGTLPGTWNPKLAPMAGWCVILSPGTMDLRYSCWRLPRSRVFQASKPGPDLTTIWLYTAEHWEFILSVCCSIPATTPCVKKRSRRLVLSFFCDNFDIRGSIFITVTVYN